MARWADWKMMPIRTKQTRLFREAVCELMTVSPFCYTSYCLYFALVFALMIAFVMGIKYVEAALLVFLGLPVVLGLAVGGALWTQRLYDRKIDHIRQRFERILPLPRTDNVFPVFYTIAYGGGLTGFDHAATTFVEGWLSLDGARASFALHAGEGRSHWQQGKLTVEFPDGQRLSLWTDDAEAKEYFRHAANLWLADRERPRGESILPPLEPHPAVRTGWGTLTVGSQLVSLVSCVLVHGWVHGGPWRILLLILAFVATPMFVYGLFVLRKQDEAMRRAKALPAASRIPLEPL